MTGINWPPEYPRTPIEDRGPASFDTTLTRKPAFESIVDELERWGATTIDITSASPHYADRPNIPYQSDHPDDSGVVARFRREGEHADVGYAIACDCWESQLENARAISLYVRRKRLAERCEVTTASSEFETARLPPGNDMTAVDSLDNRGSHEILGVGSDAPMSVIKGAARALIKEYHPDTNDGDGDLDELKKVRDARDELLEETQR